MGPCLLPHTTVIPTKQATGMWSRLEAIKPLFAEPRAAGEAFDAVIASYYRAVDEGRGGLFMAVCRGKVGCGCVVGGMLGGDWEAWGTERG